MVPSNSATALSFHPAGTLRLSRLTDYWVVIEEGVDELFIQVATSDDENPDSAAGWSIEDGSGVRPATGTGSFSRSATPLAIRVNGTINPPPALVSNIGQALHDHASLGSASDLAQGFKVGSSAATLTGIDLNLRSQNNGTTPPTVTLHSGSATGTKVADLTGPSALTAGTTANYTFTPSGTVRLRASSDYWVVAQEGSDDVDWTTTASDAGDATPARNWKIANDSGTRTAASTGSFTTSTSSLKLRVRGDPIANATAAGAPSIIVPDVFGATRVLSVDLSAITDANGVSGIAATALYRWRRFAADGTTLENRNIGEDATYTLTAADLNKRLQVVVSFTDDDGYSERNLSSAATDVITDVSNCNPPTYVGGAAQLGPARKVSVGTRTAPGADLYGYSQTNSYGSIDLATFTTAASNNYEIRSVYAHSLEGGTLVFGLDTDLSAADKKTVVLHVCDQAYAFGPGPNPSANSTYAFKNTNQDWSTHAERTIYVSQDTAAPIFDSATVNGTSLVVTFDEPLGAAASLAHGAFSGKKTPDAGSETALTFTGTPSINGNKVTLTLASASAVAGTDADVKVTYTKPTTGTGTKVVDKFGNEAATFTDQEVDNLLDDSTPPTLATPTPVVAAGGVTLTLTFSEPLKEASVPAATAFTVKATPAGGSETPAPLADMDPVTVSSSTVTLKLAAPIAHNDTAVKVSYAKPTSGSVIEDAAGNDLATFPDQAVTNNSIAPRVSIEAVYPDVSSLIALPVVRVTRSNIGTDPLSVRLDITQDDNYASNADTGFSIPAGNTSVETVIPDLDYPGNMDGTMTFTVAASQDYAPALAPNNAATMEFKAPASGLPLSVRHDQPSWTVDEGDTANPTVTFTWAPGLAAPRDSFTIFLLTEGGGAEPPDDYIEFPEGGSDPKAAALPEDWVTAAGGGMTQTVTISVDTFQDTVVEANETFYLDFIRWKTLSDALDIPLTGADNRTTISILDDDPLVVTDVEVTSSPTGGYYSVGDTIEFTVTFNEYVTAEGGPQFEFELGGATRQAVGLDSEEEMDVTFEYTVAAGDADDRDGISWGSNALSFNGGSIALLAKEDLIPRNANPDHATQAALPAHKVDTTKPSLVSAEVDRTTLTLTFSEALNTTAPANTQFSVKVDGGAGANPTAVSIADRDVTLTLAAAVTPAQTATVTYAKPTSNPIKDLSGKEADAFTDEAVVNLLADTTPPTLGTAASVAVLDADGVTLTPDVQRGRSRTSSVPASSPCSRWRATPAGGSEADGEPGWPRTRCNRGWQRGEAEAGRAHRPQRRLGQGELHEARVRRGDRGRPRQRPGDVPGPCRDQQQHCAAGEHRGGARRRLAAVRARGVHGHALEHRDRPP